MNSKRTVYGLLSLCLALLLGCASAPPSPAPPLILSGCPVVTPCQLPATAPALNGHLVSDLEVIESAWASCAAQVDEIHDCQQRLMHEQAPEPTRRP
ncbi:MAG: Rz1-like lysis system protein LysC [Pseudomonas sp.]|uniref:Rz1-like lysis system protein LysC n=1 Tax=Pseudomonas sp. TaxID=306 RepID=UPI0033978973